MRRRKHQNTKTDYFGYKSSKCVDDDVSKEFNPSSLVCTDEIMVSFNDCQSPGWTCLDRKPHPMKNEHHVTVFVKQALHFMCNQLRKRTY